MQGKSNTARALRLAKPAALQPSAAAAKAEGMRRNKDGTWSRRVRLCGERPMIRIPHKSEAKARERGDLIAELAYRMTLAHAKYEAAKEALEVVAAEVEITERGAYAFVADLIAEYMPDSTCPVFAAVCKQWNDHSLARRYPDAVPERKEETTVTAAKRTLAKYILPIVGHLPVDRITEEHGEQIKASLPAGLSSDYRRQILTPFKTVIDLCVYPLKYMKRSPLPAGFLPSAKGPRELQWLRPAEDAQLLACTAIPLHWRVLWGYLTRNGSRRNEALGIRIGQFDLTAKPMATLFRHQTKTKAARIWSLDRTLSAEGLRRWVQLARATATPSDRMFINDDGRPIVAKTAQLPALLRKHLKLAGIVRPELFVSTKTSRNITAHDLRATCITVRLACGWTEADIMQVTGHETSSELAGYRRAAKVLADIEAGDFVPLHLAIPELAAAKPSRYWRPELDVQPEAAPVSVSTSDTPDHDVQRQAAPAPAAAAAVTRSDAPLPEIEAPHGGARGALSDVVLGEHREHAEDDLSGELRHEANAEDHEDHLSDQAAYAADHAARRGALLPARAGLQARACAGRQESRAGEAGQRLANGGAKSAGSHNTPYSIVELLDPAQPRDIIESRMISTAGEEICRSMPSSVGRPLTAPEELQPAVQAAPEAAEDAVIRALAQALQHAAQAGQWAVVSQLARELEQRRLSREHSA